MDEGRRRTSCRGADRRASSAVAPIDVAWKDLRLDGPQALLALLCFPIPLLSLARASSPHITLVIGYLSPPLPPSTSPLAVADSRLSLFASRNPPWLPQPSPATMGGSSSWLRC